MERVELEAWLDANEEWDYTEDGKGLIIMWQEGRSMTHVEWHAIEANTLDTITAACKQGKDVDHITRVTGYFSRTSGWNKGKAGELKDRHRVTV